MVTGAQGARRTLAVGGLGLALAALGSAAPAPEAAEPAVRIIRIKAVPLPGRAGRPDCPLPPVARPRTHPDTAIRIAYLHLLGGEVDEALAAFREAMRVAPENSRQILRRRSNYGSAFYSLGRTYHAQGRDDGARKELRLAVESRSLPDSDRPEAQLGAHAFTEHAEMSEVSPDPFSRP